MKETTVYISIGSNLGDRAANCKKAFELLSEIAEIKSTSSLYDTAPWGNVDQPPFINCAIEISTNLSPVELLAGLKEIESRMGRGGSTNAERWAPRVIDLDILFFGDMVMNQKGLKGQDDLAIPHPLIQERAFVLVPLTEIAPDVLHPLLKKTVRELLDHLRAVDKASVKLRTQL